MTYAKSEKTAQNNIFYDSLSRKILLEFCCNSLSCKNQELDYILRKTFINATPPKHTEIEQKWMACCTTTLQKWRKKTSAYL